MEIICTSSLRGTTKVQILSKQTHSITKQRLSLKHKKALLKGLNGNFLYVFYLIGLQWLLSDTKFTKDIPQQIIR